MSSSEPSSGKAVVTHAAWEERITSGCAILIKAIEKN